MKETKIEKIQTIFAYTFVMLIFTYIFTVVIGAFNYEIVPELSSHIAFIGNSLFFILFLGMSYGLLYTFFPHLTRFQYTFYSIIFPIISVFFYFSLDENSMAIIYAIAKMSTRL